MSDFFEMQKLVELFNTKKNNAPDSESEENQTVTDTFTEPKKGNVQDSKKNPYSKIGTTPREKTEPKDIPFSHDDDDTTFYFDERYDKSDWRISPKWDISYRQKVTPSDIYLQMGNKSPATASCENMIVSVHLPGENHKNIDVKVKKQFLELVSPKFKLALPLPQPVNPHRGNAKWDKEAEKLIITLDMNREFDYINF